jgi:hypothetical protein
MPTENIKHHDLLSSGELDPNPETPQEVSDRRRGIGGHRCRVSDHQRLDLHMKLTCRPSSTSGQLQGHKRAAHQKQAPAETSARSRKLHLLVNPLKDRSVKRESLPHPNGALRVVSQLPPTQRDIFLGGVGVDQHRQRAAPDGQPGDEGPELRWREEVHLLLGAVSVDVSEKYLSDLHGN